jgi:hypothetical protein
MVRLPGGWLVRERITCECTHREYPGDRYWLTVRVSASGFALERFVLEADPPAPPERLHTLDVPRMVERIVLENILTGYDPPEYIDALRERLGPDQPGVVDIDLEATRAWFDASEAIKGEMAAASVRKIRRRRKVTPELLAEVLDLYERRGGISAVSEGLEMSERNAWRLLARARRELEQ